MSTKSCKLSVKVIPNSSRDALAGWLDDTIKIKVAAQPEKGKANKSVIKILAKALNVPTQQVNVLNGQTSQHKTIEISGLDRTEVIYQLRDK